MKENNVELTDKQLLIYGMQKLDDAICYFMEITDSKWIGIVYMVKAIFDYVEKIHVDD